MSAIPNKVLNFPLFDTDTHWTEPGDLWTKRAPEKFRSQVMHIRRASDGSEHWFLGERKLAPVGPAVIRNDLSKATGVFTLKDRESMTRAATYVPERLSLMDSLGVGTQVVYPNAIGIGGSAMQAAASEPGLQRFHVQAYNDAAAEQQEESGNRLLGQMVLPLWDINECVAEVERGRKLGLTGITMTDQPQFWKQPALIDPAWDPLWAACQSLELPVSFHIATGPFEELVKAPTYWGKERSLFVDNGARLNAKLACYQTATLQIGNQVVVLNLLVSGLLDRFPRLKFISVESGLGWVPFALQALEAIMRETMDAEVRSQFKRTPTEAFRDQIYVTYWFEGKSAVEHYVATFGSDNIMFETDFPHPASIFPDVQQCAQNSTVGLAEDARSKILYKNAEKLFGVKVGRIAA